MTDLFSAPVAAEAIDAVASNALRRRVCYTAPNRPSGNRGSRGGTCHADVIGQAARRRRGVSNPRIHRLMSGAQALSASPERTPVLAGIGVATQREDDPAQALDPIGLMLQAARRAGQDAAPDLLRRIERVAVPHGRWSFTDPARAIAGALGALGARTVLARIGVLQQTLIADACLAIERGEADIVLVIGGDTGHRMLRSRITGHEPASPWPPQVAPDQMLEAEDELIHAAEIRAGIRMPVGLYAIIENAFRAHRGVSVPVHRDHIAALYSRFSTIAAGNPAAWNRRSIDAETIRCVSERNPMQAFPYTKLLCTSWNVDQAAALLFCSVATARAAGVPGDRFVYPWASTESNAMVPVCARRDLYACPGAAIAGRAALQPFGLSVADLDLIELYSCFPIAVQAYAAELGISLDRELTVTGGMAFAGGPFNNYVLQSTARMAELLRDRHAQGRPGHGLVSSVSGVLTKQGFGLWSTRPPPGGFRFADLTGDVAKACVRLPVAMDYEGAGVIAGYSVLHDAAQPTGIVVANVDGGRRVVATSDDPLLVSRMEQEEFCGVPIRVDQERFSMVRS